MNSKWVFYKGNRILYCDYRNYGIHDLEKLKAELAYVEGLLQNEHDKSVLSITDVSGSVASTEAVNAVKNAAVTTGKKVRKQAVIGVTGLKKIFFDTIVLVSRQTAHSFDDLESAEEWLISEN